MPLAANRDQFRPHSCVSKRLGSTAVEFGVAASQRSRTPRIARRTRDRQALLEPAREFLAAVAKACRRNYTLQNPDSCGPGFCGF